MNPKAIGEISEAMVLAKMVQTGVPVLIPFGNNQRYDFVLDENGTFVRAQVKTGRLRNGCVRFSSCSTNGFTGAKTAYHGEADVFLVYCPDTGNVYRVPVAECGAREGALRVGLPNGLQTNYNPPIRWARDYVVT